MLRRKLLLGLRVITEGHNSLTGLKNLATYNWRTNLPALSEMAIHLPPDHKIFSFQRGAVTYNFTFKVAVLLFKYRITSTLLISFKSWGDHKPHVHFSLSLTLWGLWHWAQIYHADTGTSCWRALLKGLAKHKPRYFHVISLLTLSAWACILSSRRSRERTTPLDSDNWSKTNLFHRW